jgi:hypothetical protein
VFLSIGSQEKKWKATQRAAAAAAAATKGGKRFSRARNK